MCEGLLLANWLGRHYEGSTWCKTFCSKKAYPNTKRPGEANDSRLWEGADNADDQPSSATRINTQ